MGESTPDEVNMLARTIRKVLDSPPRMHYPEGAYGGAIVRRFLSVASIGFVLICFSFVVTCFAQTAADAPA